MLDNRKTILTCGDSFTFGSEIINPTLSAGKPEPYKFEPMLNGLTDYSQENDEYRISRIWPTYLGELSKRQVINIAKPAISNQWIYHSTIGWILKNYIEQNKPTEDLIVIVGWTSIVRKEFFFAGESNTWEKTLNANGDFKLDSKDMQEFFKYYTLLFDFDNNFFIQSGFPKGQFLNHLFAIAMFMSIQFETTTAYVDLKCKNFLSRTVLTVQTVMTFMITFLFLTV
jgi:hypothetical protein